MATITKKELREMLEEASNGAKSRGTSSSKAVSHTLTLRDVMRLLLDLKYWIICSAVVMMIVGLVYLQFKPNKYKSRTQILITTDRYSGMNGTSEMNILSDITGAKSYSSLTNEMFIIKSVPVIQNVVNELNLNVRYYKSNFFKTIESGKEEVSMTYVPNVDFNTTYLGKYRFDYETIDSLQVKISCIAVIKGEELPVFQDSVVSFGVPIELPKKEGTVLFSFFQHPDITAEEEEDEYEDRYIELYSPWKRAQELSANIVTSIIQSPDKGITTQGSLLELSMTDTNSKRSEKILNAIVAAYNEDTKLYYTQSNNASMQFIQNRLKDMAEQLSDIEGNLERYTVNNNLINIQSQTSYMIQSEEAINQKIQEVNIQEALTKLVRDEIVQGARYSSLPSNVGLKDASLNSLIVEYNSIVMQRNRLLGASSESNPVVIQYTAQLDERIDIIKSTLQTTLSSLAQQRIQLESQLGRGKSRLSTLPSQTMNMTKIEREKSIIEPLYVLLQRKREETMLAIVAEPNIARVIEPATLSSVLVGPNRNKTLLVFALLGAFLPVVIVVVRRLLKTKIENPEDISSRTSQPILGMIPHENIKLTRASEIISGSKSSKSGEVFRTVRANIQFMKGKVFQVTSSVPGEGKSFISTNIAISLTEAGKKVVLVETDMRKGHLRRVFDLPRDRQLGLCHLLSGEVSDWHDVVVHPSCLPALSIIPKGAVPPNPNELLLSETMTQLIEDLKGEYDYVILDSPPFLLVADPLTLNRFVDHTIYVMRSRVSQIEFCEELNQAVNSGKLTSPGIVLNDVDTEARRYGGYQYGYGYGYSYGYGYGYGESAQKKKKGLLSTLFSKKK